MTCTAILAMHVVDSYVLDDTTIITTTASSPIFEQCYNKSFSESIFDNEEKCLNQDSDESSVISYNSETSFSLSCSTFLLKEDDDDIKEGDDGDEMALPNETLSLRVSATQPSMSKRLTVTFGEVTIRFYNLVVGCQDIACPLELGWEYEEKRLPSITTETEKIGKRVRTISFQERRERIASSYDIPVSDVKYLELEMLTWKQSAYLSSLAFTSKSVKLMNSKKTERNKARIDSPPRLPRSNSSDSIFLPIDADRHQDSVQNSLSRPLRKMKRRDSIPRRPSKSHGLL